jgi:hypothetical protein
MPARQLQSEQLVRKRRTAVCDDAATAQDGRNEHVRCHYIAEGGRMPWHQLHVVDRAQDPTDLIHRTFPAIYEAAGRPSDMAIFLREAGTAGSVFYFAPGAWGFARCVHAAPCLPPARKNMSLIAGEPVAWETLTTHSVQQKHQMDRIQLNVGEQERFMRGARADLDRVRAVLSVAKQELARARQALANAKSDPLPSASLAPSAATRPQR